MPDAAGNIKGSGWSREREAGWERVFGSAPEDAEPDQVSCDCGPDDCPCCCRCGC